MTTPPRPGYRVGSDAPFFVGLILLGGFYLVLILACLVADAAYVWNAEPGTLPRVLASPEVRYATMLSLVSSAVSTILALWVAVPIGYLLSRFRFPGKLLVDAVLDIPIVLPPLVVGLSLLILFRTAPGQWFEGQFEALTGLLARWGLIDRAVGITFEIPSVILAQFMVAAAFAVRTLRATFDEITPRKEQVAMTLGCSRRQAFWMVVLPEARTGLLAAATMTWARAIGEFGPILVFSGATRFKTEVLPTTVFLLLSIGDIEGAVAVSLLMVLIAIVVLVIVRYLGRGDLLGGGHVR